MNFLVIFTLLTVVNVIASTIKTILTVNGGKFIASLSSAMYYGYYNIVLIYTVADFPLWQKVVITTVCNLIGVYLVKWMEEKSRKDKLWKVEMTIPTTFIEELDAIKIPHSYIQLSDKHTLFNFYCATQKESKEVKEMCNRYNAKYFVAESKIL